MTIFLTLLPYLLIAASVALSLGLLYGVSERVQRLRSRIGQCEARVQSEATQHVNEIAALRLRIQELETEPVPSPIPAAPGAGLNGTTRSKVLKLNRLGHPAAKIADTLRIPKGEVDLLVKVHKIVMRPYEESPQSQNVGSA